MIDATKGDAARPIGNRDAPRRRPLWTAVLVTALALTLGSPLAGTGRAQTGGSTPTPLVGDEVAAVVRAGGAALWGADGRSGGTLEPGERVIALKRTTDGHWLQVRSAAGAVGWAAADDLLVADLDRLPAETLTIRPAPPTPLPPTPTPTTLPVAAEEIPSGAVGATAADGVVDPSISRLNVRSGPGIDSPVLAKLEAGEPIQVLGKEPAGGWLHIRLADGRTGWVAAAFVQLAHAAAPAPAEAQHSSDTPASVPTRLIAPGLTGKLVLQTKPGGPIYLYFLATGELRPLTTGVDPALSPDGSQVVFAREGGENGIYLIGVDGANERKIFGERGHLRSPKFSPDGRAIVFSRGDELIRCRKIWDGRCYEDSYLERVFGITDPTPFPLVEERLFKLARIDVNGGGYRDLPALESAQAPDWNAGGIVYTSSAGIQRTADSPGAVNALVIFDILKQYYQDPDWQPAGEQILYQQRQASHWEIFSVRPDGSAVVALTRPVTTLVPALPSNVAPAWSPDGRHVAYLSSRDAENSAGTWGVWIMDADGSNSRRLPIELPFTYGFANEQMLDWGP